MRRCRDFIKETSELSDGKKYNKQTFANYTKEKMKLIEIIIATLLLLQVALLNSCHAPQTSTEKRIHVGVFNGDGASPVCVLETMEALKLDTGICPVEISGADIVSGKLNTLDALIFPGGSGSKEYNNLGQEGARLVKDFVSIQGKGLVGICAGGFLFSATPGYPSLEILGIPDIRDHYDRGRGLLAFHLNNSGKEIFPELENIDSLYLQYYDGPIFDVTHPKEVNILGDIYSDIDPHPGYPHNVTPGKPALLNKKFGKGKVFVSVGHPEATAGMRWMVPRMVRWVTGSPPVLYEKELVRPQLNDHDIFYTPETILFEKENFWNLFSGTDSIVIHSLENLYSIRSRPSIRWAIGLLRHQSPRVRLTAANYLLETEYTWAIPDLEADVEIENDPKVKEEIQEITGKLKKMIGE